MSDVYLSRIGSHSGRKTLSQLLWEHGFSRQLIADAGGWYIKREAVDLYFRTSAQRAAGRNCWPLPRLRSSADLAERRALLLYVM